MKDNRKTEYKIKIQSSSEFKKQNMKMTYLIFTNEKRSELSNSFR